jgi:hypothetical protein
MSIKGLKFTSFRLLLTFEIKERTFVTVLPRECLLFHVQISEIFLAQTGYRRITMTYGSVGFSK